MTPADFTVAKALADNLLTTCEPQKYWDELETLTHDQCLALDSIVFECTTCNHWFPVLERLEEDGRFVCKDCCG
jgi:predicted nucleic acid-binding Zn ribbon protein